MIDKTVSVAYNRGAFMRPFISSFCIHREKLRDLAENEHLMTREERLHLVDCVICRERYANAVYEQAEYRHPRTNEGKSGLHLRLIGPECWSDEAMMRCVAGLYCGTDLARFVLHQASCETCFHQWMMMIRRDMGIRRVFLRTYERYGLAWFGRMLLAYGPFRLKLLQRTIADR